jgi:dihydropteroate synthase
MVHVPVSIDTYYSSVASAAVAAGADMVNDVSGGTLDPSMLPTVAGLGVPYVLMHMRGTPQTMTSPEHTAYKCVWEEVGLELQKKALQAMKAGILPWNLLLDPGLGFAKSAGDSAKLLGRLRDMTRLGLPGILGRMPLLVGPSRKGFIGKLTGESRALGVQPWDAKTIVMPTAMLLP